MHCFTCGKDIHAARRIAEALTALGIAVLRFDFTGLGGSEGEFANTTFSSNVADLVAAADQLRSSKRAPAILIGHSLGGAAVLAAASQIPEARAVVTIGAPCDPAHVTGLFKDKLDAIGEPRRDRGFTGRPARFAFVHTFLKDIAEQNLTEHIASLHKALLIFHSPTDEVVGIENASQIFAAAKHPKSFVSLAGADHLLSRRSDAVYVANVIAAWAERYLDMPEPEEKSRVCRARNCRRERDAAGSFSSRRSPPARTAFWPTSRSVSVDSTVAPVPTICAGRARRLHVDDIAALRRTQGFAARSGDRAT